MTCKKIMIIGSWAKEHITAKNIKQSSGYNIYAFIDTKNPGIIEYADGYTIGALCNIHSILEYAKEISPDLILVTTAEPLKCGVVDLLTENNFQVFGPNKKAAALECDKSIARKLLRKYMPDVIPEFRVFSDINEAVDFAEKLNWDIAVKPLGLTEGLGVKVMGDQLSNRNEASRYLKHIIDKRISGESRVLIEEKLTGEEFTIQCFVHGENIIPTPPVQDFKKRDTGDTGPNTASMGSYSMQNHLLPFLTKKDITRAMTIIKKTIEAFQKEYDTICSGFLYGQFMRTDKGIKLIEYNFRPGDPEWINTVTILKDNIADIVFFLLKGKIKKISFEKKATVCKYIVPPAYPDKLYQTLDISFNRNAVKQDGIDIYWSAGKDSKGNINVGTERGIAFCTKDTTIIKAHKKINKSISQLNGSFHYRKDIGSRSQIQHKILKSRGNPCMELSFEQVNEDDFQNVQQFVAACPPLECYPQHLYRIMFRYGGNTCFVARFHDEIIGFVMGFFSQTHKEKTYFLWQIGIKPYLQGLGIAKKLITLLEDELKKQKCRTIELTIDPENKQSRKLFLSMGFENRSSTHGETIRTAGNTAIKDFYGEDRHFMLFQKDIQDGSDKANDRQKIS